MVISEIRALYQDENDLLRTVIKRIYEEWNPDCQQWVLKKIEYIFTDPEFPIPSDAVEVSVETRHGWLVPPEWEFVTETWVYTRKEVNSVQHSHTYDPESDVEIIR